MYPRFTSDQLRTAVSDRPVVLLHGARQTGKSTLVKTMAKETGAEYLTLDDVSVLTAAKDDPSGFLASHSGSLVLDEVQHAPELFVAIKVDVDRNRRPGRFVLTGSANVLLLPRLSDSLAGRMEILTLWPLSQGEIDARREGFIDRLFSDELPPRPTQTPSPQMPTLDRAMRGGFPEVVEMDAARRYAWFQSYLMTILQRDVRDMANIESLTAVPKLLSLLATRIGSPANYSEIGRDLGMPQTTLRRYMGLLQATFLVQIAPAWFTNRGKRLAKSPKLYLVDSGLAGSLMGFDAGTAPPPVMSGPLIENFIVMELRKQLGWCRTRAEMFHFRTQTEEVDIVLEAVGGRRIVGIEVKAGRTLSTSDFKGLRALAEMAGSAFHRGVVLYEGDEMIPFGHGMFAMPIRSLWQEQRF